ncbi:MAG: FAD:protein FMN transferase [Gammaproteobacteria bacterium]|nr:FAD:protein FMN transferase [Gammaproteobacteria bacterium]
MHYKTLKFINTCRFRLGFLFRLAVAASLLNACSQDAKQYNYSIFAFGTLIDITLYDVEQQLAEDAFEQLQKDFDWYQQNWSSWTNGDLAQLNIKLATANSRSAPPISVPGHLIPLIKTSMVLSEKSHNYYNPAIGRLINLWQFHKYQDADIQPPDNKSIMALVGQNPQMSDLSFNQDDQLLNTNPSVSLNFGAFAKGYAIGLEIEKLKKYGIHNAVINAGGDLTVIGQHGDRAWNIGIRDPRSEQIMASVSVSNNESVFTSGDYERVYIYQGQRYHHILDPSTGYPTDDAQSVTVIDDNPGLADAAATAIFVAGSENWPSIAKKMGIRYVMLVDAKGDIHLSPAMQKRIKILNKLPTSHIIISKPL